MDIDKKLVKKIATLSRVKIEEKEVERISKDLSKIITWVEKLNEVDTKDVTPVANPSDIKIPFRKDEINDGKIEDKILKNFDWVVICTYSNLNSLIQKYPNLQKEYQFEVCEKPVVKLPESFRNSHERKSNCRW